MTLSAITLNQAALPSLQNVIACPQYPRDALSNGIVHIGVGGFHRSHQAYYLQQLFNAGLAHEWAITGVGLMEFDRALVKALNQQDGLYTLTIQEPDGGVESQVIGSITHMLLAIDTPRDVVAALSSNETKIISMTITEGGYNVNPNTGEFNFSHPGIQHDLANPDAPQTVFGYLTLALRTRRESGGDPVTLLSCDNVEKNGDIAKMALLAFAQKQDPETAGWIEANVTFPNAMVDRITPVTSEETRTYVREAYQLSDALPVNCEPFIQWVIEDKFAQGRPPLEQVGVQFVPDVTPYEEMKLRLLNAGHSVVGIVGALHGYDTIDACIADTHIQAFLRAYLDQEASPVLEPVEGIDVDDYKTTLIARFGNPHIKDKVSRICSESSAKLPKFVMPTLRANLNNGGPVALAATLLAAWCLYSEQGKNERGEELVIIDVLADELAQRARSSRESSLAFLAYEEVFGDLAQQPRFVEAYLKALSALHQGTPVLQVINDSLQQ